jgi:hypothetical protein
VDSTERNPAYIYIYWVVGVVARNYCFSGVRKRRSGSCSIVGDLTVRDAAGDPVLRHGHRHAVRTCSPAPTSRCGRCARPHAGWDRGGGVPSSTGGPGCALLLRAVMTSPTAVPVSHSPPARGTSSSSCRSAAASTSRWSGRTTADVVGVHAHHRRHQRLLRVAVMTTHCQFVIISQSVTASALCTCIIISFCMLARTSTIKETPFFRGGNLEDKHIYNIHSHMVHGGGVGNLPAVTS